MEIRLVVFISHEWIKVSGCGGAQTKRQKTFPPLKSLFWGYLVWQRDASLVPMFITEDFPSSMQKTSPQVC